MTDAEYWPKRVGQALVAAFVTFFVFFPACCAGMTQHFEKLRPHGERNGLGGFYFAVPAAGLVAVTVFAGMMLRAYLRARASGNRA